MEIRRQGEEESGYIKSTFKLGLQINRSEDAAFPCVDNVVFSFGSQGIGRYSDAVKRYVFKV